MSLRRSVFNWLLKNRCFPFLLSLKRHFFGGLKLVILAAKSRHPNKSRRWLFMQTDSEEIIVHGEESSNDVSAIIWYEDLADDLWIHILTFLSTEELTKRVRLTSKRIFGPLLQSIALWNRLLARDFTTVTTESLIDDKHHQLVLTSQNANNEHLMERYRQLYYDAMFPYDLERVSAPLVAPYFVSNIWLVGSCLGYGPALAESLRHGVLRRLEPQRHELSPPPSTNYYLHHFKSGMWSQKMQLWLSCGPSRFQACSSHLNLSSCDCIVSLFDLDDDTNQIGTDRSSLSVALSHLTRLLRGKQYPAILAGISMSARNDHLTSEQVSTHDIHEWCSERGIYYIQVRSSDPDSLFELIRHIAVHNSSSVRHRKTMRCIPSNKPQPENTRAGTKSNCILS